MLDGTADASALVNVNGLAATQWTRQKLIPILMPEPADRYIGKRKIPGKSTRLL